MASDAMHTSLLASIYLNRKEVEQDWVWFTTVKTVVSALDLSDRETENLLGRPNNLLKGWNTSGGLDTSRLEYLRGVHIVRIYRILLVLFDGDNEAIRSWFRSYNKRFHLAPIDVLDSESSLSAMLDYLKAELILHFKLQSV